jgi:hypothetical protein
MAKRSKGTRAGKKKFRRVRTKKVDLTKTYDSFLECLRILERLRKEEQRNILKVLQDRLLRKKRRYQLILPPWVKTPLHK